jgi:hypothetical protein
MQRLADETTDDSIATLEAEPLHEAQTADATAPPDDGSTDGGAEPPAELADTSASEPPAEFAAEADPDAFDVVVLDDGSEPELVAGPTADDPRLDPDAPGPEGLVHANPDGLTAPGGSAPAGGSVADPVTGDPVTPGSGDLLPGAPEGIDADIGLEDALVDPVTGQTVSSGSSDLLPGTGDPGDELDGLLAEPGIAPAGGAAAPTGTGATPSAGEIGWGGGSLSTAGGGVASHRAATVSDQGGVHTHGIDPTLAADDGSGDTGDVGALPADAPTVDGPDLTPPDPGDPGPLDTPAVEPADSTPTIVTPTGEQIPLKGDTNAPAGAPERPLHDGLTPTFWVKGPPIKFGYVDDTAGGAGGPVTAPDELPIGVQVHGGDFGDPGDPTAAEDPAPDPTVFDDPHGTQPYELTTGDIATDGGSELPIGVQTHGGDYGDPLLGNDHEGPAPDGGGLDDFDV